MLKHTLPEVSKTVVPLPLNVVKSLDNLLFLLTSLIAKQEKPENSFLLSQNHTKIQIKILLLSQVVKP